MPRGPRNLSSNDRGLPAGVPRKRSNPCVPRFGSPNRRHNAAPWRDLPARVPRAAATVSGSVRRGLRQTSVEILLASLLVASIRPGSLAAGVVLRVAFLVHRPAGFLDSLFHGIHPACACTAPRQHTDESKLPRLRPSSLTRSFEHGLLPAHRLCTHRQNRTICAANRDESVRFRTILTGPNLTRQPRSATASKTHQKQRSAPQFAFSRV